MDRQPTPPPPGWYPDQRDPRLVRFWDGRQWTAQTAPAHPPAPADAPSPSSSSSSSSLRDRWRRFRLRTKLLLVVGALVVFGALLPDEDTTPDAAGDQSARTSDSDPSADVVEVDGSTTDEEDAPAVEEEPEEEPEEDVEEILVPALRAKSLAQARSALRRAGLDVTIVRQPSWEPAGRVLKQGTKAGAVLLAGAAVTLVVAAPMPRVPGVLGKGAAVGQAALTRAGFKVAVVRQDVSTGADNVVLSQTPAATQQAAPGSVVRLVVSNFVAPPPPSPTPVPTPVPLAGNCTPGYQPCLPPAPDYDCAGGSGDGPEYASGPIRVTGSDPYDLDSEGDGIACE